MSLTRSETRVAADGKPFEEVTCGCDRNLTFHVPHWLVQQAVTAGAGPAATGNRLRTRQAGTEMAVKAAATRMLVDGKLDGPLPEPWRMD